MAHITPRARLLRGVSAAVLITFLAVASHETGGGKVSVLAGLLALVISALTCVILAGKVLTPLRSGAAVVVGQGLYHMLFTVFPADGAPAIAERAGTHGQNHLLPSSGQVEFSSLSPGAQRLDVHGDSMWVAHVVAAAIALIVVLWGEEAWWQLIRALSLLVRRLTLHMTLFLGHAAPIDAPPSAHDPILTSVRFVVQTPTRRGPPINPRTSAA